MYSSEFSLGKEVIMTQQSRPKFCNRCGAVLEVNYNFCKDCGNPITVGVDISSSNPNQYINNSSVGFWNKLSNFGKIIIIGCPLLILIGIGACLTISLSTSINDSNPVKSATKTESSPVNQVIDFDDFWAEQSSNQINFESKYLNPTVQLSGIAGNPSVTGASYEVRITSPNPLGFSLRYIRCFINKETAMSLSSGQKIVVSGTLTAIETDRSFAYEIKNCIVK